MGEQVIGVVGASAQGTAAMIGVRAAYRWLEQPHRLLAIRPVMIRPGARILDVGCGNHSPLLTKSYFPDCEYHGLDRDNWNLDDRDTGAIDRYHSVDLEDPEALRRLEGGPFDAILCSHVLEHLADPYSPLEYLVGDLAPGGVMYIEVPAAQSLRFPRAANGWYGVRGCLNFYDDPTHKSLVDLLRVKELLQRRGLEVTGPKPRRMWRRVVLLPAYVAAGIALRGYVPASVLWDVSGFAQSLLARRPTAPANNSNDSRSWHHR